MKKTFIFLILINTLLLGLQFGLSLQRSSDGQILTELQTKTSELRLSNQLLESQIEQHTSISSLATRAVAAGLVRLKTTTLGPSSVAMVHQVQ